MAHHAPCPAEIKKLLDENKKLKDENHRYREALGFIKNRAVTTNLTNTEIELLVCIARKALQGDE